MVTLKDIATKAGVSIMTVSRVMNGKPGKVSKATAEKIRSIADEMGYIPNSSARSLAARSSHIIAVVFRNTCNSNPLDDPYTSIFLGLITNFVQERGYYIMIHFVCDFSDITYRLQSWNAEGAIFLGLFDEEIRQIKDKNQIPLIFTDSYSNERQIMNVGIDDYKGGELAGEHFLENGHTSLGFIGYFTREGGVVSKRCQGFKDTVIRGGGNLTENHIYDLEKLTLDEIADLILSDYNPPTGIFVSSDEFATELYGIATQKGLKIPENLSIIGFDDFLIGRVLPVPLTTIHQNVDEKAKETCNLLFDHINNPDKPCENIVLDVQLISRDSVADLSNIK